MKNKNALVSYLKKITAAPILESDWQFVPALILDLTSESSIWSETPNERDRFEQVIKQHMQKAHKKIAIGRYNEERVIYQDQAHFSEEPQRSLHIGIDLGVPVGTKVQAPFDARLHSFADNNAAAGDYGPTIILQHCLAGLTFYTLYGHLSRSSLANKQRGCEIKAGELFATVGDSTENGGWAPHLHFQIIKDLQGHEGDYPGVVDPEQADYYLANCPDPNLILGREDL